MYRKQSMNRRPSISWKLKNLAWATIAALGAVLAPLSPARAAGPVSPAGAPPRPGLRFPVPLHRQLALPAALLELRPHRAGPLVRRAHPRETAHASCVLRARNE